MKRAVLLVFFAVFVLAGAAAQVEPALEVSFTYSKQSGSGSNQFAVWIENADGRHVKTLFATRFTAGGGFKDRPLSLPTWVKQAGAARMTNSQIDVFSAPTPASGRQTLRWDGSDMRGEQVPGGNYTLYIEGTLRNEKRVLCSAPITVGATRKNANVNYRYSSKDASESAERRMLVVNEVRILR